MVFKKKEEPVAEGDAVEDADIAAPKPKKAKAPKPVKKLGPKLVPNSLAPAAPGHNSGDGNPALKGIIDEILASDVRVKNEGRVKRDLRNRAKTEFGITSAVLAHEIRLRKMDSDVRIQFESSHHDLKNMLGYQIALDLQATTVPRTEEELVDPSAPKDDVINRHG